MSQKSPLVRNPVHSLMTIHEDGSPEVVHSIYCKRQGELQDLEHCRGCEHLESMPLGAIGPGSSVRCHAEARAPEARPESLGELAARTPIVEVLRRRVLCVEKGATWEFLEGLLLEQKLDAVPVLDESGLLVGIVSKTDLLRASRDGITEGVEDEGLRKEGLHEQPMHTLTAADLMTPAVHCAPIEAPLSLGIAMLALENVDQIPILAADGKVAGVLATRDVVRWFAKEMGYVVRPPGA